MKKYQREFPRFSDPLGETLYQLRLNGSLYALSDLSAPWGMEMPVLPGMMMFHIITQGQCWLQLGDREPILMRQGSLALVPHGLGHRLMDELGSEVKSFFDLPVQQISERYEVLEYGGGGTKTKLTCCVMSFDHVSGQQLITQLPEVLHIDSWDNEIDNWLQQTLRFIAREAHDQKPGGQTIMSNLADILVIQAIRTWIDTAPEASKGWLAALKDKQVGRALAAIHRQPEKNWTIANLAKDVGLSRSGLAARFTAFVGEPVIQYLTRWRMLIARSRLQEGAISLGELAGQLGYQSEAAFSRAFKRTMGVSPGSVRKKEQAFKYTK
ncbi:AraC family transcriptional regulator [Teredinibacter franksiae]|jgi:transcriptional regulator, AraC family|uniref:AraC family transcriptional regulator n=1 Tax=Teredinibacter franksiae TaxID=2761453 RepID=UPI001629E08E|nr:AraC family transcriptional regulator [Teredinibacter franksiae]